MTSTTPLPSSALATTPCSICHGREFFFLSPWRSLDYGANGWFARPVQTCAHVPERGFLSRPSESDILRAPMSLRVCAGCGAAIPYTDPAAVRAMLAAGQPGVSHTSGEPGGR